MNETKDAERGEWELFADSFCDGCGVGEKMLIRCPSGHWSRRVEALGPEWDVKHLSVVCAYTVRVATGGRNMGESSIGVKCKVGRWTEGSTVLQSQLNVRWLLNCISSVIAGWYRKTILQGKGREVVEDRL